MKHIKYLRKLRACDQAVEWAEHYLSLEAAWAACQRGDWMLWLAGKSGVYGEPWSDERKPLVAACIACARTVQHPTETLAHMDTIARWCRGEASEEEAGASRRVLTAAAYADSAAYAADAAAYAADAAAYAAYAAADAAAYAAYTTDDAAYAAYAAYAATYDAAYDARNSILSQCADIVRAMLLCPDDGSLAISR